MPVGKGGGRVWTVIVRLVRALITTVGGTFSNVTLESGGGGPPQPGTVPTLKNSLAALHMNADHVVCLFGDRCVFPGIDKTKDTTCVGLPVDARPEGDLTKELAYSSHSSKNK